MEVGDDGLARPEALVVEDLKIEALHSPEGISYSFNIGTY